MSEISVQLFDDIARIDATPARYTESSYDFLNRSAWPEVENIRNLLESWFSVYPASEKQKLKNEFMSATYSKHFGAWWELYIFAMYRALGYQVKVHPEIPNSSVDTRPDFLVLDGSTNFYVECTAVSPRSHSGEQNWSGQAWIYDAINEVNDPNFYIGLRVINAGTRQPRVSEITRPLRVWLAALDADACGSDIPAFRLNAKDWELSFSAYPIAPAKRTGTGRLLGILPPSGTFIVNDVDVLHSALRDKGGKYGGRLDKPLIVALASVTGFTDDEDVTDAVFGRKAIEFSAAQQNSARLSRLKNGYWRPADGESPPRGARVSGVLFGQQMSYRTVASAFPKLWVNPWAHHRLTRTDPFAVVSVQRSGETLETPGTGSASLFGLPDSWPN
ncbi:hypothetical protein [Mycolicibacterium elephantis]|uniref:hypothetical protein n=1 Tax=Mycolicibacterium elephantis TaxID=81858 RepID=UPI000A9B922B|nr:hypothetical protein [Mycolicibacterium elephantis]